MWALARQIRDLGRLDWLAFNEIWSLKWISTKNSIIGFFDNQECCVFIQYNLLKGCCKWTLMQPWINCSLPGFTWHIRLRISISHLSIFGIVVHGRCCIYHCLFFSIFVRWCLFIVFVFISLDSSFGNQNSTLTSLHSFWLVIKFYNYYHGSIKSCYSILCY